MTSILLPESVDGLLMYVATRLFAWSYSSISRASSLRGFWAMMSGDCDQITFLGGLLDSDEDCGSKSGKLFESEKARFGFLEEAS